MNKTTQVQALTDEQIDSAARKYVGMGGVEDYRAFARDIAALSAPIAAAPAAPEQDEVRNQALNFVDHIINGMFEGGDWDGAAVQELAIKYGLLKQETVNEPCGDDGSCQCAQNVPFFPAICFRKTYTSSMKRQAISEGEKGGEQ